MVRCLVSSLDYLLYLIREFSITVVEQHNVISLFGGDDGGEIEEVLFFPLTFRQ